MSLRAAKRRALKLQRSAVEKMLALHGGELHRQEGPKPWVVVKGRHRMAYESLAAVRAAVRWALGIRPIMVKVGNEEPVTIEISTRYFTPEPKRVYTLDEIREAVSVSGSLAPQVGG